MQDGSYHLHTGQLTELAFRNLNENYSEKERKKTYRNQQSRLRLTDQLVDRIGRKMMKVQPLKDQLKDQQLNCPAVVEEEEEVD